MNLNDKKLKIYQLLNTKKKKVKEVKIKKVFTKSFKMRCRRKKSEVISKLFAYFFKPAFYRSFNVQFPHHILYFGRMFLQWHTPSTLNVLFKTDLDKLTYRVDFSLVDGTFIKSPCEM